MFRDNVPCLQLAAWPLECTIFEGEVVAGPVPTLFGESPDMSRAALTANPEKAFSDSQRILRCFLMPELLDPSEADSFIKKPRYRNSIEFT